MALRFPCKRPLGWSLTDSSGFRASWLLSEVMTGAFGYLIRIGRLSTSGPFRELAGHGGYGRAANYVLT